MALGETGEGWTERIDNAPFKGEKKHGIRSEGYGDSPGSYEV